MALPRSHLYELDNLPEGKVVLNARLDSLQLRAFPPL